MSKPKLNIRTEQVMSVQDWNELVVETYKRPYNFQQQDGCKDRGTFHFIVPAAAEDYENTRVKEIVNGPDEGVSFAAWLARDPKEVLSEPDEDRTDQWAIDLWWHRNFYPTIQMVANDLHSKGILPAGSYTIDIDW